MIVADTSVVVPAVSPWHEHHEVAARALDGAVRVAGHAYVETFATLTRLPEPFRVAPHVAAELLGRRFGRSLVHPSAATVTGLPGRLAAAGISGGASYDALIALTAQDHGASLLSLDGRAAPTYTALGVPTSTPR